jgi:hypothetical protein
MLFGSRESRPAGTRPARRGLHFRPRAQRLEGRQLLAAIDLVGTPTTPFGVEMLGAQGANGTGFSSADVGDVNGDGFDDFLIGAPTINTDVGNFPTMASGNTSQAYLVFGSNAAGPVDDSDFLSLDAEERIGDLDQLGNQQQNNPISGNQGFPFNGLTFEVPSEQGPQLGASVAAAGDVNGDGFADFLIGSPQGSNPNDPLSANNGRAYLVYGGAQLATRTNKVVDLDVGTTFTDISVITFFSSQINALAGRGVAGIGDFFPDGIPDIAIGAPGASLNGLATSGAVFAIPGSFLRPARTQVVDLLTVAQPAGIPGAVFTGEVSGQGFGFSVAGPGDVEGFVSGQQVAADLLVGAPNSTTGLPGSSNGVGAAYLVYGGNSLLTAGQTTGSFSTIIASRIGDPAQGQDVSGAVFAGDATGDLTGYAVSTAGDFNADGLADFLIGSPGFNAFAGRANLIYGRAGTPATPGPLLGDFILSDMPDDAPSVQFLGEDVGDLVGFAVGAVGFINNDQINEILIGSPGDNSALGTAYLIPGNPDLIGDFLMDQASIQNSPTFATVITNSQPSQSNFLGASVAGRPFQVLGGLTIDTDSLGDFSIGAPALTAANRSQAGMDFLLEGAFIPLADIVSTLITSPIGVGSVRAPFIINATTPDELEFFILSAGSNTAGFSPFRDINPNTITVNGVPLPDPATFTNAGDLDGDGIDDASFIFSPRSLLALPIGNVTITVNARTVTTGTPFPDQRYQGQAAVLVTQGGVTPEPPAFFDISSVLFPDLNAAAPRFGERFLPTLPVIGRPQWGPLAPRMAYRQFLPPGPFSLRMRNFFHPGVLNNENRQNGTRTLGSNVFTRSKFPKGVHLGRVKHDRPVIGGPLTKPFGFNPHTQS